MKNKYKIFLDTKSRRIGLSQEERDELRRQQLGDLGESLFKQLALRHNFVRSELLFDLSLKQGTSNQLDALIIHPEGLVIINVKYYNFANQGQRRKHYANGICKQLEDSRRLVQEIFYREDIRLPIQTAVVFMNPEIPYFNLETDYPQPDHVVQSPEVNYWLNQLKLDESQHPAINSGRIIAVLKMYQIPKQYPDHYRPLDRQTVIEKCGQETRCQQCGQYLQKINQQNYNCPNNHRIKQSQLILEMVEDFMVLTHSNYVTTSEVKAMLPSVSLSTIRRTLLKNFKRKGSTKNRHYFL